MARTSLPAAKAEIVSTLEAARASFGDAIVFDHQPPINNLHEGKGVCVFTVGATPTSWRIAVRVLVSAAYDIKAAQDVLDEWMPAVVNALSPHYGPEDWTTEFATDDAPYYAATNVLEVGREDF